MFNSFTVFLTTVAYLTIFPVVLLFKLSLALIRLALFLLIIIVPFVGVSLIILALVLIIAPLGDTHNTIANAFKENSKVS
jgi:hypothetical protein